MISVKEKKERKNWEGTHLLPQTQKPCLQRQERAKVKILKLLLASQGHGKTRTASNEELDLLDVKSRSKYSTKHPETEQGKYFFKK